MGNNTKISPDIILKKYWENKERFADLFNAVLFQGERVIQSEDLQYEPTEVSNHIENEVFEAIRQEGEVAGQAKQIVRMSMKYHATDENILSELVTELKISTEQAKEYLNMFGKQPV